jgi:hypothetical protein
MNPPPGNTEGTGLGLPISRKLIENLGGSIAVKPREPRGSVFVFDLKLALATRSEGLALPVCRPSTEEERDIWLFMPTGILKRVLKVFLTDWGWSPDTLRNETELKQLLAESDEASGHVRRVICDEISVGPLTQDTWKDLESKFGALVIMRGLEKNKRLRTTARWPSRSRC